MTVSFLKRLVGIKCTPPLLLLAVRVRSTVGADSDSSEQGYSNEDTATPAKTPLVEQVRQFENGMTRKEANQVVQHWNSVRDDKPTSVPLSVVTALGVLFPNETEDALRQGTTNKAEKAPTLVYTSPPPSLDDIVNLDEADVSEERRQFLKRMQRLRLQNEETKYAKLTESLHMAAPADDVTTRSMTYAASIGLNMIVAPLSFGAFMYFFGGSLLDRAFGPMEIKKGGVDIRRVVVGVVSGVIMLFIEMILFVIRTHEMEKALRMKDRKKDRKPGKAFGYYNSHSLKTYTDRK